MRGSLWAGLAILIWSGSLVALKWGVATGLTGADLTALRFATAACVLAPVLVRSRRSLPPPGAALRLVATFGAPYVLLLSLAMKTVPAAAAGARNPGAMALVAVLLAPLDRRARPGPAILAGIVLTCAGLAGFVLLGGGLAPGHLILLVTGLMWALYGRTVRRAGGGARLATALVAVGSAALYLPVYLAQPHEGLAAAAPGDLVTQIIMQGLLVSVVAVYAFTRSVELLGPVAGPSLPALIPLTTLLLDRLVLGEQVPLALAVSAGLITLGVLSLLSPGRRPRR